MSGAASRPYGAPDALLELTTDFAYDFGLGHFHHHRHHLAPAASPPAAFGYFAASEAAAAASLAAWDPLAYHHHPAGHPHHQAGAHHPFPGQLPCDLAGAFSLGAAAAAPHPASSRGAGMGVHQRGASAPGAPSTSKASKARRRVATIAQRRAANIRERRRMFNLNSAFDKLRKKVPTFAYEKRLSRIETLRLAIMYIAFMTEVIRGGEHPAPAPPYDARLWTAAAPHAAQEPPRPHICSRQV